MINRINGAGRRLEWRGLYDKSYKRCWKGLGRRGLYDKSYKR
ncbi:hypothetical protein [Paenibacillus yanchengensis]